MTAMATGEGTASLRQHVVVVGADSTSVRLVEELIRAGEQLVVVAPSRSIGAVTAAREARVIPTLARSSSNCVS